MNEALNPEQITFFKRNQFKSFKGVMAWVFLVMPVILLYRVWNDSEFDHSQLLILIVPVSLLCSVMFFLLSVSLNYIGVSGEGIFIRNHNLFFLKSFFPFEHVAEIALKGEDTLEITKRNGEKKTYAAESLSTDQWLSFKMAITEKTDELATMTTIKDAVGYEKAVTSKERKERILSRTISASVLAIWLMGCWMQSLQGTTSRQLALWTVLLFFVLTPLILFLVYVFPVIRKRRMNKDV